MEPDFKKSELIPAIVQDYYTKNVLMLRELNKISVLNGIDKELKRRNTYQGIKYKK